MLSYNTLGYGQPALHREHMPFTLRLVRDDASLQRAVELRHRAYSRHVPEFASGLATPEAADRRHDSVLLLAESKLDGQALSTMRIQTNALAPLALEASVALPACFAGQRLAEATRLAVVGTREGQLAKTLMFKAYFLLCLGWGVERMVVTARRPVDRLYEALTFTDVLPGGGMHPMQHVGGLPHRLLSMDVATAEVSWRSIRHPLTSFVFDTDHPDLMVDVPDVFAPGPVAASPVPPAGLPTRALAH